MSAEAESAPAERSSSTGPRSTRTSPNRMPNRIERKPKQEASLWGLVCGLAILLTLGLLAFQGVSEPETYLAGFIFSLIVLGLGFFLIKRFTAAEKEFDLGSIALLGLTLRILGSYFRVQDTKDAGIYWQVGTRLATSFRQFEFNVDTGREIPGTGTLRYLAGLAQVLTGDNMYATFMIWVLISFTGCLFLYRAFELGVPGGNRKRYALLVFCWPSLVFWPSSLGKEGWMMLGIGVAAYGAALFFSGVIGRGLGTLFLGTFGATMVRPHVGLLIAISFAAAVLIGSRDTTRARRVTERASTRAHVAGQIGGGAKVVAILLILIGGAVLSQRAAEFFKVDALGTEGITEVLDQTGEQTFQGGGAFTPAVVRTPLDYPKAFVTVMFRPFPFEARGLNDRLVSVEGLVLLGLLAASIRQIRVAVSRDGRGPMVVYAAVYSMVFVFAFSAIGNFGILARQRVQVLPLIMFLACLPPAAEKVRDVRSRTVRSRAAVRS